MTDPKPPSDPKPDAPKGKTPKDEKPKTPLTESTPHVPELQTREQWVAAVRARAMDPKAKLLPEEWFEIFFPGSAMPNGAIKREGGHKAAQHGAAKAIHGWDVEARHCPVGDRLRLSKADYTAALKATTGKATKVEKERTEPVGTPRHPGKRTAAGPPEPHPAALSEWPAKLRELTAKN